MGPKGPEAGVWVIAETRDLPRPLHQERRDGRPWPVRRSRSPACELPGLGARLRPRRQRQDDGKAWTTPRHHRGRRAERGRRSALLSCDLLVLDAEDSRRRSIRRQEQHPRAPDPDELDQLDEEQRVHRLPSARARNRRGRFPRCSASLRRRQTHGGGGSRRVSRASRCSGR